MLYKKEVQKVLNCPHKSILDLAIQLVNLKDKERIAIDLVDIRGITQEQASEVMKCSPKSVCLYRKKAFEKMGKAWEDNNLIKAILEEN